MPEKYILRRDTMKSIYESRGKKAFALTLIEMIRSGKLDTDRFSFKALWEAVGQPTLTPSRIIGEDPIGETAELFEAVESSVFPTITGELINRVVQDAYQKEYGVGEQLVTVIPSEQKDDVIVGWTEDMGLQTIGEGMPYQEGAIGEKYHKIYNTKWGRIIKITDEMVKFDQTNQVLTAARRIGEAGRTKHERVIMDAVLELISTGNRAAWRPAGTAATLYSNTSTDPYTSTTQDTLITDALADETDLTAALKELASMIDEQGDPITVTPKILLSAIALKPIAEAITRSGQFIQLTSPAGVFNTFSSLTPLSTPFIDQLKGQTYWYLGDFKKQFVYTEVFPLQTMQARPGNDYEFSRDIAAAYKVRFMGGCGAVTNRYVIESTGGG